MFVMYIDTLEAQAMFARRSHAVRKNPMVKAPVTRVFFFA